MALAKLSAAPPQVLGTVAIDVSEFAGEETILTFREPSNIDLFAVPARVLQMQMLHPDFPPSLAKQVLILGGCYVPSATDAPGTDPDAILADVAINNRDLFLLILGQFVTKFPIAAALSAQAAGNA